MVRAKIIKADGQPWRPYRFPPRYSSGEIGSNDPATAQRAIADGFQEGIEKGYQEGLLQGREAGHQAGLEQGVQEGIQQGYEEGRTQGRQEFDEAGQLMGRLIDQFRDFQEQVELARREELLELVKKVAKQVIRVELTLHPTQLLALAEEALAAMPSQQEDVRILLNPEEYARIKDLAPDRAAAWHLVPDEKLALGECRVVTTHTETDIGCQQRLDSCMDTLAEHMNLES